MVFRTGGTIQQIYGPGKNNEPTLTVETIPSGLEIDYESNMVETFPYPDPNNGSWNASYQIEIDDPDIAEQVEGYIFTLSATGYESITFNSDDGALEIEEVTMTPSNDVSVLSDGTNSYAIKDAQARSDIASLQTNKVPTTRTVNGKALSSDITLTASDVGALSSITSSDVTTALGYTPLQSSDISNMVTTNTDQTITGKKVLGGKDKTMLANTNITKGTNPASTQYINLGLFGDTTSSYTDRLGCMETSIDSSGNVTTFLRAYKNEASSSAAGSITVNYPGSGSPYATAPTPTEDTNNSVQIDTVGARNTKLADYALDSDAVKTSGTQTVGGNKTFTNPIIEKYSYDSTSAPNSYTEQTMLRLNDTNGILNGAVIVGRQTNGNIELRFYAGRNGTNKAFYIGVDTNGNAYTSAPTPSTSDNSTKIATTAFVKNQNYVDLASSQNITGTKTFTNSPIFNMQCYTASNGSSNASPYKKIGASVKTGANQITNIPFMFCASNTTNTSGTYNGKIVCRTSGTAGSATVSASGIILNGNPDFISNGNIVFYLMYKNNYPESNQVTFELWVYVKNTYQGVNIIPMRIGTGGTGQDISAVTWGNNMTEAASLPDGFTAINQIIL